MTEAIVLLQRQMCSMIVQTSSVNYIIIITQHSDWLQDFLSKQSWLQLLTYLKWQCCLTVWLPGVPHSWRGGEAWGRNTRNQFRISPAASHRNPRSSSVSSAAHGAGDWADAAAVCPRGSWKKEFRWWTGLQGMEMVNSSSPDKTRIALHR